MKNKQKQESKGLDRLVKAFRASSIIFHILLFVGGVAIAGVLIWLFVHIGVWVKLGI